MVTAQSSYDYLDLEITITEVDKAIKKLVEGKATYLDNVDNMLLKCLYRTHPNLFLNDCRKKLNAIGLIITEESP